jgi:cell wall-associated NlpC family hydrolase
VGKFVALVALALSVVVGLALLVAVAAGSGSIPSDLSAPGTAPTTGGPGSGGDQPGPAIPSTWLPLYRQAAATCPGMSWSILAAVGTVETGSGRSTAPGVWSGANSAGAEGPLQFEPATFSAYAAVGPGGARPASPYDPVDAVYTASALLCADGAGSEPTLRSAITDYNHSAVYATTVLTLSLALAEDPTVSGTAIAALTYAAEQLGTPYVWGGTGNGGFDCSGLAQAAYRAAGITLPRVAQDQFDAGPVVPATGAVQPGDLLFFGTGPSGVDHVGLYVGAGEMIDAPHTGADVRFDDADWPDLVGVTRPG